MLCVYVFSFFPGALSLHVTRYFFSPFGLVRSSFGTSSNFVCGLFTLVEAPLSLVFSLLMQFSFSSVFRPEVPWRPLLCFFFSGSLFSCLVCSFRRCKLPCLLLQQKFRFFIDFLCDFRQSSVSLFPLAGSRPCCFPFLDSPNLCNSSYYVLLVEWFASTPILTITPDRSQVSCLLHNLPM